MSTVLDRIRDHWAARDRAQYLRDDECDQCLQDRPLLMPVVIHVPGGDARLFLCLACRLDLDDKGPDRLYGVTDDTWRHLPAVRDGQRELAT